MKLTPEQIAEARNWISDCDWHDLGPKEIRDLGVGQVESGVERHYAGGTAGFISDFNA